MFKSQEANVGKLFDMVDVNNDGTVDGAEFLFAGKKLQGLVAQNAGDHDLGQVVEGEDHITGSFSDADTNDDGVVDWEEWKQLLFAARELCGPAAFRTMISELGKALEERRSAEQAMTEEILQTMTKVKVRDAEVNSTKLSDVARRSSAARNDVENLRKVMMHIVVEMEDAELNNPKGLTELKLR